MLTKKKKPKRKSKPDTRTLAEQGCFTQTNGPTRNSMEEWRRYQDRQNFEYLLH
jgi:hypothetical protein